MKVEVRCPACKSIGKITVDQQLIDQSVRGLTAVTIASNLICEHAFVAYVDKNRDIRDYILCDFLIDIPEIELKLDSKKPQIKSYEDFDVDIIKLNIYPSLLVNVLKGILFKKDILIILDNDFLRGYVQKFLLYITEGTFSHEVVLLSRKTYPKVKKEYKKFLILENAKVIKDKDKILNQKKLKFEKAIVQKFFEEKDPKSSLLIIINEIKKIFILSKKIVEFNNNLKNNQKIDSKMLLDHFKAELDLKIQFPYLRYLMEIVKSYFQVDIEYTSDTIDFFKLLQ